MTDPNMKELIYGCTYQRGVNDGLAIAVGSRDAVGSLFNKAWESGRKEQSEKIAFHQIGAAARDPRSGNWGILDTASGLFSIQEPRFVLPALLRASSVQKVATLLINDPTYDTKLLLGGKASSQFRATGTHVNAWDTIFGRQSPADQIVHQVPTPQGNIRVEGIKVGNIQWFKIPQIPAPIQPPTPQKTPQKAPASAPGTPASAPGTPASAPTTPQQPKTRGQRR